MLCYYVTLMPYVSIEIKNPSSGNIKIPNKSYYVNDIKPFFTLIRIVEIPTLQFS